MLPSVAAFSISLPAHVFRKAGTDMHQNKQLERTRALQSGADALLKAVVHGLAIYIDGLFIDHIVITSNCH